MVEMETEEDKMKIAQARAREKEIWNEAIEQAAKIANKWNLYCEEEIRSLKK